MECISPAKNYVYEAVREALLNLGLDKANYGTAKWNPFGDMIRPDSQVIVKPNFVNHRNFLSDEEKYFNALVTHSSVIRAVLDFIIIAGGKTARITIADLPMQGANFDKLIERNGLDVIRTFYKQRGFENIGYLDLRKYFLDVNNDGSINGKVNLPGDPLGYIKVNLAKESSLVPIEKFADLFVAPDYDGPETVRCHSNGDHRYVIPKSILTADVFINLPKLKVHRKVGVTLSLKNLVGIIGDKTCLPHWRKGDPAHNGDEFALSTKAKMLESKYSFMLRKSGKIIWKTFRPIGRLLKWLDRAVLFGKPEGVAEISHGDWYGNDTIWRMVHDLNKIIIFADAKGSLSEEKQRKYLTLIDGIVGGQGEGPLKPEPVNTGYIIASTDPLIADITAVKMIGFDWRKIPQYSQYACGQKYGFSDFKGNENKVSISYSGKKTSLADINKEYCFSPSKGWLGHIEAR
ncbi:MAG: DUF362 domain-containing protein [Candidatus Edwardsbacteria bacterium]|nr:DUF362 domain-containing protein [Candidatus Edwardsbacteria bacterium]